MKIKDRNCPEFSELKKFVFEGEYEEIDNWFQKHQISKKPSLEHDLILRILNEHYFFSFHCSSTSRNFIEKERRDREITILKNFKCENQLRLFGISAIEEVTHEHFKVFKLTPKNKELIQNSASFSYVITKLFNDENFDELNKISDILKMQVLDQKSEGATFFYREQYSRGSMHFKVGQLVSFSPKFDLIFNYTDAKKDYLDSKGIQLPTIEEAATIHHEMLHDVASRNQGLIKDDAEKIENAVNSYKIQKNYLDLKGNLQDSNKTTKKIKI